MAKKTATKKATAEKTAAGYTTKKTHSIAPSRAGADEKQIAMRFALGQTLNEIGAAAKKAGADGVAFATKAQRAISAAGAAFYKGDMNEADFARVLESYTHGAESNAARAIAAQANAWPGIGKAIFDGVGMLLKVAKGVPALLAQFGRG